ncbi:MAG: carboxypeptidase-like regulatory domain-containing protein [Gemmatimonadota bacterium]
MRRGRLPVRMAVGFAVALGMASGCARAGGEIGGEVPATPLQVIATNPVPLSTVDPFDGSVRIEFQRTLSERPTEGPPADAVVVSPRLGDVQVSAGRGGIEISMEGGFRVPSVYRITVLPRFRDRYDNPMPGPFDLIFSTGPELEPNLLAGIASDFLTLDPLPGVRVDAMPSAEGPTLSTVTDSVGIFTFPYLPAGRYTLVAYDDLNRNREPDFSEPQDVAEVGMTRGDTLVITSLALLEPDTTAAVFEAVAVLDSLTLEATFDDYLIPESLAGATAVVTREGANAPEVLEVLGLQAWRARQSNPDDPPPPGAALPTQDVAIVLSRPLLPEVEYTVEVSGIQNVQGIGGGGGSRELTLPAPPPPPPSADAGLGQDPADPDGFPIGDPDAPLPADPDPPVPADPPAPDDPLPDDPLPG